MIRSLINSPKFPFEKTWDLRTEKLQFYFPCQYELTEEILMEHEYVCANVIKDHPTIHHMCSETVIDPGMGCFMAQSMITSYMKYLLILNEDGTIEINQIGLEQLNKSLGKANIF